MTAYLRYKWEQRYEEAKHNSNRLNHLANDFFLSHEDELRYSEWHNHFHKKVLDRYEEVAYQMTV